MTTRARVRVGKMVTYRPTDAEASTGGDSAGALWPARITKVNATSVNLFVHEADGTVIAKTSVSQGGAKGQYSFQGLAEIAP